MTSRNLVLSFAVIAAVVAFARAPASAIVVPGTSDPWLAGMPDGSTASTDDSAPGQSPVLATGITLTPGEALTFGVTGWVNNGPGPSGLTPDGGYNQIHYAGAENGISNADMPVNALLGVFLDDNRPDTTAAPAALDFTTPSERDYLSLSPLLKQVFFIGDGLTSASVVQQVVVPTGATRLYLGSMDGFQWNNNDGAYDVRVNSVASNGVPEPGSLAILTAGLPVLLGLRLRRRASR